MQRRLCTRTVAVLLACSLLSATGCDGNVPSSSEESSWLVSTSSAVSAVSTETSEPSGIETARPQSSVSTSYETSKNSTDNKTSGNTASSSGSKAPSAIDFAKGGKPAKRANSINGFVRRQAKWLVDENGDEWFIKGGGIDGGSLGGAGGWNPLKPDENFCNESIYKEHAELGCNTIRFTFNEALFFTSRTSSKFNENGFNWIKKNVEWAKKYHMRLILNMHVVPGATQGGSNEPNVFLANNKSRWLVLWREIARRFADEPVILGYSFWNEQCAPSMNSYEESLREYGKLYQECIDVVRAVDKKHLIICEQMNHRMDSEGNFYHMTFPAFPTLNEKNILYEYHNYGPYEFTFQGDTQPYGLVYGSDAIAAIGLEVSSSAMGSVALSGSAMNGKLTTLDSGLIAVADKMAVAGAVQFQFNGKIAGSAALCLHSVEVKEYDASGRETGTVYKRVFNSDTSIKHYTMTGAGIRNYEANTDGGALSFGNLTSGSGFGSTTNGEYLKVRSGYRYRVLMQVRGRSLPDDASLRSGLQFFKSDEYGKTLTMNKECLQAEIKPYVDYRNKNNVPVFCGEWGAYYKAYDKGLNSQQWAQDQLDVFKENNMYFTVHTPFAMYSKALQPYSWAHNPEIKAGNYTVLEDAFRRLMPSI